MKKRVFALLLACLLTAGLLPTPAAAAETAGGSCGSGVQWTLYDDGRLLISGSGAVTELHPWYDYRTEIRTVEILEGVTKLSNSAFFNCTNLTEVTLPDSLVDLGNEAFSNCQRLKEVVLPDGLTTIGDELFFRCFDLTSVTIPDGITSVGNSAFAFCESLTSLTLPDSVTRIGTSAFEDCVVLRSAPIPASLTSIGEDAFNGCASLERVVLPEGVTKLPDGVFFGCKGLTYIGLPASLTQAGQFSGAFNSYTGLVCYAGSKDQWSQIKFPTLTGRPPFTNADILYDYSATAPDPEIDYGSYYRAPNERIFQIYSLGEGYPAPIGYTITMGSQTYSGYSDVEVFNDRIQVPIDPECTEELVIQREGYYTQHLPAQQTDLLNCITMVPTTVTGPFSYTLLLKQARGNGASYKNLLYEYETYTLHERQLEETDDTVLHLRPGVDWNGHGEGQVWLEQGEIRINLVNDAFNEIHCSNYYFKANETIYLCGRAQDGTSFRSPTGLRVYKPLDNGLSIDLGDTVTVDTGSSGGTGDLSILVGEKLKLDLSVLEKAVPIQFSIKKDGSLTGAIGLNVFKASHNEAVFGLIKDSVDRLSQGTVEENKELAKLLDEMKKYGIPLEKSSVFGASGKIQVLGYLMGQLEKDGGVKITECKIALIFSGTFSYTYNTAIMVGVLPVPGYFKASLSAKLSTYLRLILDRPTGELVSGDGQYLDTTLGLTLEAGPGWEGYASGAIRGSGALEISNQLPIDSQETTMSLMANFSLVGTLAGQEGEWVVKKTPKAIFWQNGDWCWEVIDNFSAQSLQFLPDLTVSEMQLLNTGGALVSGISGYTPPVLARLSDGRLLAVWSADVPGRSAVDSSGLYYSLFSGGSWSAPALVHDDGTNDSLPRLHQENGVTYLAWQNYTRKFQTDELPPYGEVQDQIQIVVSAFDPSAGTWGTPQVGTPDWYPTTSAQELPDDYQGEWPASSSPRQVLSTSGLRAVLYTAADEQQADQVWGLFHDGSGWGQPIQLTHAEGGVNGFSAVLDQDELTLLYTSGALASSDLLLEEIPLAPDLAITDVDYIRQTFVPGQNLILEVTVKNNGARAANGLRFDINTGSTIWDTDLQSTGTGMILPSGGEEILHVSCPIPEFFQKDALYVTADLLTETDSHPEDNTASCTLYRTDLSVETLSVVLAGGQAQAFVQVVNRGQARTQATTLTFCQNSLDGPVIGTTSVPGLAAGKAVSLTVPLSGTAEGEMVYVRAEAASGEAIVGNNTLHAVTENVSLPQVTLSTSSVLTGDSLNLSIRLQNQTTQTTQPVTLVVALYDAATGRQLDCQILEDLTAESLDTTVKTVPFASHAPDEVYWKVFVVDDQWKPVTQALVEGDTRVLPQV